MAFFDDLGKKLSQAGQNTIQKTKEMADVARINSMISDEEKRIHNNYVEIGKLYVALHGNDYENDFSGFFQAIADSEAKIKQYHNQIQEIKGIKKCSKCGAEVPAQAAFCNVCGAAIETVVQTEDTSQSEISGNQIPENKENSSEASAENMNTYEEPKQEATAVTERVCPNCGSAVGEQASFCGECGTKL